MPNTPLNKEELAARDKIYAFLINYEDANISNTFREMPVNDLHSQIEPLVHSLQADRDAAVREARIEEQLEGKQQAWNTIWAEWLKGDDDEFDDFMRQYNAELWPPESQPNAKEGDNNE